ncbi:MAG: hypothetical protein K2F57_03230 [Candidatus Gastranaerophilales bacterium]|nr:hypothetical protein [Candidatus Gastranaerophilales bacterium]
MSQKLSKDLNDLLFQLRSAQSFYKILLVAIMNNGDNNSNLYLLEFAELIEKRLNRICKKLDKLSVRNADIKILKEK